ncbi:parvulin-like peptidyl-prolyl isomerase [Leptolyngbyaceae cyanobacterium JSC-12]|nr:parvulin-like peptidyl-prolyl isomerase [Leptolyngbyaceae cyanobacterium JSC-12]
MITFKGGNIESEEIISALKRNVQIKEVCQKIIYQRIINQAVEERGISITSEEIQTVADQHRYEHRLFRASDTFAWLSDQMITAEDWEAGIRDRLLAEKLAQSLFANEAKKYFAEHQADFDQVLLYRLVVPYEKLAQEIFYEIQEGEISFYEAAHIYDVDAQRRYNCGYEGKFYRWNLKPDLSAIVFGSPPGNLIGPLMIDQTCHLLLVEECIPAELTSERYQEILNRMFSEWLTTELNYLLSS